MLFFRDFVLYESNDNLTINKQAITTSLGNWFAEYEKEKNASHENDQLYVLTFTNHGDDGFIEPNKGEFKMSVSNGIATKDIKLTQELINKFKTNGNVITCAIIEPSKDDKKTNTSLPHGLKLPKGYKVVTFLDGNKGNPGNWGDLTQYVNKTLRVTYNFADSQMNIDIPDREKQPQEQKGNDNGNDGSKMKPTLITQGTQDGFKQATENEKNIDEPGDQSSPNAEALNN